MTPNEDNKLTQLLLVIILLFFLGNVNSDCGCRPVSKNFNETVKDVVGGTCRKCYMFTYHFTLNEDWAPSLCVSRPRVSPHIPLLVAAREYLSVTSFQVPQVFEDERKSSFKKVCRILCPLANYFDDRLNASQQHIFVELSSPSSVEVQFEVRLTAVKNFVIVKNQPLTVNITPSQPRVMQYNMEDDLRAVRIEAVSSDAKCMILHIEDIQCPFSDSELTVELQGFYQTLKTKSGITVSKGTFSMGRMYIVLILRTTNDICTESTESYEEQTLPDKLFSKEVTVRIVPAISDEQFYLAVFLLLLPYMFVWLIALAVCIWEKYSKGKERQDVEDRGTTLDTINNPLIDATNRDAEAGIVPDEPPSNQTTPAVIEKTTDVLPDAPREREVDLAKRSRLYIWNLVAVAIFFAVPAFQLVVIKQGIINLTGNQDLCYYNFLCSYQFGWFSDFNHFYSNIGYVVLGVLFLLIVRRRENICATKTAERRALGNIEAVGVPYHFGIFYAMGWASVMEGVLSATYHVCPNRANFQFDTAIMYVIATTCMVRLYQARHPEITAKAHIIWIFLAMVVLSNGGDVLISSPEFNLAFHIIIAIIYLLAAFLVSVKIYYMGCEKFNTRILDYIHQNREKAMGTRCYGFYLTECRVQFFAFVLAMIINIVCVVLHFLFQMDFASSFLYAFILNASLYFGYYLTMKFMKEICIYPSKEEICIHIWRSGICITALYLVVSLVLWCVAVIGFFIKSNAEWKDTPAESREKNSHCSYLHFYDNHDIWHFLSSFAIFISYMMLLTIDDDQQNVLRSRIDIF